MKPFKSNLEATKWAEQFAHGTVTLKTCPNYGASVFTVKVLTICAFGTLGFISVDSPSCNFVPMPF
jgi:hypothetical protein